MGLMKPLLPEEVPAEYAALINFRMQTTERTEAGKTKAVVEVLCPVCSVARDVAINDIRNFIAGRRSQFPGTHRGCRFKKEIITGGYVKVYAGYDHVNGKSTYKMKHRLVMEEKLGRPLTDKETVHHIDGNRQNNDPSNLQLRLGSHGKGQKWQCGDCDSHNIIAVELD